jgi:hypothetical protein
LNHPCPQNPTTSCGELGETSTLESTKVVAKSRNGNNFIIIPMGVLGIRSMDTPGEESTAEEVTNFVKDLILAKLPFYFSNHFRRKFAFFKFDFANI